MIEKHNFHWKNGFMYDYHIKRDLYYDLEKEKTSKQIIAITGLRRTGKTIILKQVIDSLIKDGILRENILFFTFDEEQPRIEQLLSEYEAILGKNIIDVKSKIYVFLDEIQKLDNWQNQIKYYYDNYNNLKFFVSGSSSLFIKKNIRESLAGRIYEFNLGVLSFKEFLLFKGKDELYQKANMFREQIIREFLAYQKRQFIEIINESDEKIGQYMQSIIEKIIYQDIPKIFPIENPELLMRILKIIAFNPGLMSDYESLSKDIGISRITISNYFYYLEESFLIKKIYNFSKNMLISEKKMKKFYLTSTSFYPFLNNHIEEPKLIENLAVIISKAKFFWRNPQKQEVDIIVFQENKIIPIEIKYRENIDFKEIKSVLYFCEKFKLAEGLVISKNKSGNNIHELKGKKISIKYIPIHEYILS